MVTSPQQDQLVYVHGGELGLSREQLNGKLVVLDTAGAPIDDEQVLARVHALSIPPAWTDVWIAADDNAHLQATGLDSRGRRQYLYHPLWRARRDEQKFEDMLEFAERLPTIRATSRALLEPDHHGREQILALAVRLLDIGLFRVGWDRYARDNGHVGLTTLRREHVSVSEGEVRFDYVAKSGKRRRMTVNDPQSVRALAALKRRRGPPDELLTYRAHGHWHRVHAPDVNDALRSWAQGPYSAKEFRTWAATVLAEVALARQEAAGRRDQRAVNRAVKEVSVALGNTPAVARKSYIDPRVISLFEDGVVIELPDEALAAPEPLWIEATSDGVVMELPTDVDGDAVRLEIEQRVRGLLSASR
ncbi:MAG TPA: DNA topoisomerase IB [Solirubrobacteraceae bacterium]|nr:DNA topoisomerase IB [Solirubrobacteraceae bacterium]